MLHPPLSNGDMYRHHSTLLMKVREEQKTHTQVEMSLAVWTEVPFAT